MIESMTDADAIHRCLELAARGRIKVGTNPMVGAVLVRNRAIIAEGWHEEFGVPHAERMLIDALKSAVQPSDVLYVNLEPCCHEGKTPPCTNVIIESGIKNVVYGMLDPDTKVMGKGTTALKKSGITVSGPVLPEVCQRFNRGYVSLRTKHRPWITLKRAQTKQGAMSHDDGSPLKITSPEQDAWAHEYLRAMHDAILVGVGTIVSDNPQLTVRNSKFEIRNSKICQPHRIIFDPDLRIPLDAHVVNDEGKEKTIVITNEVSKAGKALVERGVTVISIPMEEGCFDLQHLWDALSSDNSQFHGVASVLVEGGPKTWDAFQKAGVVDEEVILVGQ